MNPIQKLQFFDNLRSALISGVITAIFMYFVYYQGLVSLFAGMFIGFSIHISIAIYTGSVVDKYFRKLNLVVVLLINTIVNLLIMMVIAWFGVGIFYMKGNFGIMISNIQNVFGYYYQIGFLFGFTLSIFFNFYSIINTLIGKSIIGKLFIGKYRTPFEVERTFMFIDLKSSTSIAEKIGHKNFLSFVNDFFYDLSIPVSQTKGDIYKYVGDEAIISWKMKNALRQANCIRCFTEIQNRIEKKREYYMQKYGAVPAFKAGLHGGTVITGELGYTRREIAFMGDVVNTTARIEEACTTYDSDLLVSQSLFEKLSLPDNYTSSKVGNVMLRGKSEEVGLMAIELS